MIAERFIGKRGMLNPNWKDRGIVAQKIRGGWEMEEIA